MTLALRIGVEGVRGPCDQRARQIHLAPDLHHAVGQGLVGAQRTAELLAGDQVFAGDVHRLRHHADGFRRQRQRAKVERAPQQRLRPWPGCEDLDRGRAVEDDLRRVPSIIGRIALHLDARPRRIHQRQRRRALRIRRRDHQRVRVGRPPGRRLAAGDPGVGAEGRAEPRIRMAPAGLEIGERRARFAQRHALDQAGGGGRGRSAQDLHADHRARNERRNHQAAAERLEHPGRLRRRRVDAARVLRRPQTEHAGVAELGPQTCALALRIRDDPGPTLEVERPIHEAGGGCDDRIVALESTVHFGLPQSPMTRRARISRWISLAPEPIV